MSVHHTQRLQATKKRLHVRYAGGGLQAALEGEGDRQVEVVDLSTGGLAIATSERLRVDSVYTVHVRYRSREVEFPCRVAWSRLAATRKVDSGDVSPWYLAGLSLRRELGPEGLDLLATIQQLALTTLPVHLQGRARLPPRAAPETPCWYNIQVLRISQKGLSCEIGTEPEPFVAMDVEVSLGEETLAVQGRLAGPAEPVPGGPGLYRAGVEFSKPSGLAKKVLADYMAGQLSGVLPRRQPA